MDTLCGDIHLARVGELIVSWEVLAPYFGLSPPEEEEIKKDNRGQYGLQKRKMLWKWKARLGNDATYSKLCEVFCDARNKYLADKVKEILLDSTPCSVLVTFKQYLEDCYSARPHPSSSPREWPQLLDASFIDPKITLKPRDGASPDFTEVAISDVLRRGGTKVLLEGVAGSGKTTVTWHVCRRWAEGKMFREFDYLIHLTLADPELHSANSIEDIIPHPSSEMRKAVADAIIKQNGKGCCFILDGWEDLPSEARISSTSVLACLLHGDNVKMSLPQCSFLVTSRPAASDSLIHSMSTVTTMEGFADATIDLYAKEYLSTKTETSQQFLVAVRAKPSAYSLCNLPINLVAMMFLFLTLGHSLPSTQTELYESLVLVLLLRHLRTKEASNLKELLDFSSLPASTKPLFDVLCKLAHHASLNYQSQSKVVITSKQLGEAGLATPQYTLGLMKVNQQLTCRGYASHYSFLHSSVQDFLCALWITKQTSENQNKDIQAILDSQPTSLILPFVAGLTKFRDNYLLQMLLAVTKDPLDAKSVLVPLMNNPKASCDARRKILALLHCIFESQKYEHFLKVRPPYSPFTYHNDSGDVILSFHFYKLSCHDCTILGTFLSTVCSKLACALDLVSSQIGDNEMMHLFKPILELKPKALMKDKHQFQVGFALREKRLDGVKQTIYFCLDSNNMTHISVKKALKPVLSTSSVISELVLRDNFKNSSTNTFKVMVYLIEGLHRNDSCRYLGLGQCCLDTSRHIYHWVLLLTQQSILNTLGLSFTNLSVGFSLFCSALRYSTLVSIFMDYAELDDDDILHLASAIKIHKSLLEVSIEHNPFSSMACRRFIQSIFDDNSETKLSTLYIEEEKVNEMKLGWDLLIFKYYLDHKPSLERPSEIKSGATPLPLQMVEWFSVDMAPTHLPKTLLTGEK